MTHTYHAYKQESAQVDLKLKELAIGYQELASFKEKQIKQAEEQIRQNQDNKDPSVLEGVKSWHQKMTGQLKEAKDKYTGESDQLITQQRKMKSTLEDLEDLIEDTIDDVIEGVRKEKTSFDNSWIPTYEVDLDAPAQFVKFVGYNLLLVQDVQNSLYFFTADELVL